MKKMAGPERFELSRDGVKVILIHLNGLSYILNKIQSKVTTLHKREFIKWKNIFTKEAK